MTDGLHQVCLSQTYAAVDVKDLIIAARIFRHGKSSGMGQFVGLSADEGIKGIFGIQIGISDSLQIGIDCGLCLLSGGKIFRFLFQNENGSHFLAGDGVNGNGKKVFELLFYDPDNGGIFGGNDHVIAAVPL